MVSTMLRPSSSYDELWQQVDYPTLDIPEQFNLPRTTTGKIVRRAPREG